MNINLKCLQPLLTLLKLTKIILQGTTDRAGVDGQQTEELDLKRRKRLTKDGTQCQEKYGIVKWQESGDEADQKRE